MSLSNVAFVTGVPFDLCSFYVIQEEHAITLRSRRGPHARWTRIFPRGEIRKLKFEATPVARCEKPSAFAAAV